MDTIPETVPIIRFVKNFVVEENLTVGTCPECRIMSVKVMQSSGAANYSNIAAGVMYAAQKGVKVFNISLRGYANSNTLRYAVEAAASTYGAVGGGGGRERQPEPGFLPRRL